MKFIFVLFVLFIQSIFSSPVSAQKKKAEKGESARPAAEELQSPVGDFLKTLADRENEGWTKGLKAKENKKLFVYPKEAMHEFLTLVAVELHRNATTEDFKKMFTVENLWKVGFANAERKERLEELMFDYYRSVVREQANEDFGAKKMEWETQDLIVEKGYNLFTSFIAEDKAKLILKELEEPKKKK